MDLAGQVSATPCWRKTRLPFTGKSHVNDLAIFGGVPTFADKLHVGRPNVGNRERLAERITELLDRRWLTNQGPFVHEFETRVSELLGVKHCIATCNGTIALEIAIRALDMTGEVIVPSFTFIATAHALQWQEITPVFCDVDPQTHNLDPRRVEALITPRTTGILATHVWGRPCAINELVEIAARHQLKLLFDAAHAFSCTYHGRKIGNFGNAEVLSFHATKFLNTFEGGAVVTNDDDLAKRIRLMTNFGFAGYDQVIYLGINGKMSEPAAAMGLTGLESLDEFIAVNHRNYSLYRQALSDLPGVTVIQYDESEQNNYQYIVLEIDENATKLSRDLLLSILHGENVLARRYFYPGCHQMEPYRSRFPQADRMLPITKRLATKVLSVPTGTSIDEEEIYLITSIIRLVLENGEQIRVRLTNSKEPR
jgi:dTDP-4-amino-4,6-dideoxygalactose transaminase